MFIRKEFEEDKVKNAAAQTSDEHLQKLAMDFVVESDKHGYAYQWTWLGLPIIQLPQDILMTQEIIWANKPDVIIETGIAWGGSVVLYASLMQLYGKGKVVAIDLNLYDHVKDQIMNYPFSDRIHLLKGSSTDQSIVEQVKAHIEPSMKVMVLLDSNHTHEHVLDELRLYGPLVTEGQHLVISDTIVEDMPVQEHRPREWDHGNNPKTAVYAYLKETDKFEVDESIQNRSIMTFCPHGFLKCVK